MGCLRLGGRPEQVLAVDPQPLLRRHVERIDGNPQIKVRLDGLDNFNTVGLVSHGGDVTVDGVTRTSMQAVRNATGSYDIYGRPRCRVRVSSTLVVPNGPIAGIVEATLSVKQIQSS